MINKIECTLEIQVSDGAIYNFGDHLSCAVADRIAQANGFAHAEQFTKEYECRTLKLDKDFKIEKSL